MLAFPFKYWRNSVRPYIFLTKNVSAPPFVTKKLLVPPDFPSKKVLAPPSFLEKRLGLYFIFIEKTLSKHVFLIGFLGFWLFSGQDDRANTFFVEIFETPTISTNKFCMLPYYWNYNLLSRYNTFVFGRKNLYEGNNIRYNRFENSWTSTNRAQWFLYEEGKEGLPFSLKLSQRFMFW